MFYQTKKKNIIQRIILNLLKLINLKLIQKKEIEKIENCLCQVNMITADQELLIEIIDQIEDKEAKKKYIRKFLEQQNSKPKLKTNLSNAYQIKDICQYYKQQQPATL